MEINNHGARQRSHAVEPVVFPPLELITRPTVDTVAAAYYLNRKPQTLRGWACNEDGPIRALRVNGRLAWNVGAIRQLMGVSA
jgi:hypothetical protein